MEIRNMRETLNPITPETTPTMFFVSTAFRSSKHLKVKEFHEGDVEIYIGIGLYLSRHVIQSLKSRQLLKFPQFKSPITVLHL